MTTQYAFFYFMKQNSPEIHKLIPSHVKYWEVNKPSDYIGGPFKDQSGGLILFKIETVEMANELVNNDPFVLGNVIEQKWMRK